jgi:hypothetical protein
MVEGSRHVNEQREQILRQLQELAEKGADEQQLFEVMRQALSLRPVPHDLLRTLLQRHHEAAQKAIPPEVRAQRERLAREHWDEYTRPSQDALDPAHPVGAAACAIRRAALPEFEERTLDVRLDFDAALRGMKGQEQPTTLPPGFAEGRPVSYWHLGRGLLIQDDDGSVYTQYELLRRKASRADLETTWKRGFRVSDVLVLSWLRPRPLEVRDGESLLRRIGEAVIPQVPISFTPYDEPRYRSGLRMQIGALAIPGATGGVLESWPGIPDDAEVASVRLYLESWASARSGRAVELAKPSLPWLEP